MGFKQLEVWLGTVECRNLQEPCRTPEMLCERATGKLPAWLQDSANNTDCAAGLSEMVREDLKAAKRDEWSKNTAMRS